MIFLVIVSIGLNIFCFIEISKLREKVKANMLSFNELRTDLSISVEEYNRQIGRHLDITTKLANRVLMLESKVFRQSREAH